MAIQEKIASANKNIINLAVFLENLDGHWWSSMQQIKRDILKNTDSLCMM